MGGDRAQAVVALGGGHGLHATLQALRRLLEDVVLDDLTAVVTVADNGGSSGRLRGQFDVLPPGDLRMALAALCGDDEWGRTWARVLQHRFAGDGDIRGHVAGNLLLVALWEQLGDDVAALDWVGRLLGARGRVLPMALSPLDIEADVSGLDPADPTTRTVVRGQVEVATTTGRIEEVRLLPADARPSPAALEAIAAADREVLGPGTWFTSVLPHLLLPGLVDALESTQARLIVVLNLTEQEGETPGFAPADHLQVLVDHAPGLRIHTVLADRGSVGAHAAELDDAVRRHGARLVLADVARAPGSDQHDPQALACAFEDVIGGTAS